MATGAPLSTSLGVPGEDLDGVVAGLDFLQAVKRGEVDGPARQARRHRGRRQRGDGRRAHRRAGSARPT